MKNQEKRLKSEHSDDYVEIRAGLVAFKGNVGKLVAVGIGGLGIYAGYRWIKGYFDRKYKNDKSKDETNSASSSNEINQEYQTIFPTVVTQDYINSIPTENYDNWQLVGKLISIEEIAILYCEPGLGKSVMAHQIACDVAKGTISLIAPDDQGLHEPQTVLYYDAEMNVCDYQRRYSACDTPNNMNILLGFYFKNENEWLTDLESKISSLTGNIFVVLDNITGAFKNMSAESMRYFLNVRLKKMQESARTKGCHITFLIVAHTTKDGVLGGAMNLQNFGTTILHIKPYDETHIELAVEKSRNYGNEIGGKRYLELKSGKGGKHFEFVCELSNENNSSDNAESCSEVTPKERMYKELTDDEIIELYDRMQNRQIAGETQHSIALDFGIPDPYISRYMKKVPNIMKRREKLQKEITPDNLEITQSYSDNIVIAENQQNNKQ